MKGRPAQHGSFFESYWHAKFASDDVAIPEKFPRDAEANIGVANGPKGEVRTC
jgi:hypothetical protein